jgi:hypothetical protein
MAIPDSPFYAFGLKPHLQKNGFLIICNLHHPGQRSDLIIRMGSAIVFETQRTGSIYFSQNQPNQSRQHFYKLWLFAF